MAGHLFGEHCPQPAATPAAPAASAKAGPRLREGSGVLCRHQKPPVACPPSSPSPGA